MPLQLKSSNGTNPVKLKAGTIIIVRDNELDVIPENNNDKQDRTVYTLKPDETISISHQR